MLTPFADLLAARRDGHRRRRVHLLRPRDGRGRAALGSRGPRGRHPPDRRALAAPSRAATCCWRRSSPRRGAPRRRPACSSTTATTSTLIEAAFEAGAGAALADGSALPFEQNVELVARAVELARGVGAAVEAELGGISGDEDVARGRGRRRADRPRRGRRSSWQRTGAACLAVSIGNVHGIYRDPPRLDWERLEAIRSAVAAPLSLHGASGIPDGRRPPRDRGAAWRKINVNTELREAYLGGDGRRRIGSVLEGSRLSALHAAQTARGRRRRRSEAAGIRHGGKPMIRRLDHVAVAVKDTEARPAALP